MQRLTSINFDVMKIRAIKEKTGTYEIYQTNSKPVGGIFVNKNNFGIGFVENLNDNQYFFEFEDGVFSKSVKIFHNSKNNLISEVKLNFTDNGNLELFGAKFEWQSFGLSKIWLDAEKNIVLLFDLEHNAETTPNILTSSNLDVTTNNLLVLCGWYLIVIEYRAGFSDSILAGMPAKIDKIQQLNKTSDYGKDWIDLIIDASNNF